MTSIAVGTPAFFSKVKPTCSSILFSVRPNKILTRHKQCSEMHTVVHSPINTFGILLLLIMSFIICDKRELLSYNSDRG